MNTLGPVFCQNGCEDLAQNFCGGITVPDTRTAIQAAYGSARSRLTVPNGRVLGRGACVVSFDSDLGALVRTAQGARRASCAILVAVVFQVPPTLEGDQLHMAQVAVLREVGAVFLPTDMLALYDYMDQRQGCAFLFVQENIEVEPVDPIVRAPADEDAYSVIMSAKSREQRVDLLVGNQLMAENAGEDVLRLAAKMGARVWTCQSSKGTVDETHRLAAGVLASPPTDATVMLLGVCMRHGQEPMPSVNAPAGSWKATLQHAASAWGKVSPPPVVEHRTPVMQAFGDALSVQLVVSGVMDAAEDAVIVVDSKLSREITMAYVAKEQRYIACEDGEGAGVGLGLAASGIATIILCDRADYVMLDVARASNLLMGMVVLGSEPVRSSQVPFISVDSSVELSQVIRRQKTRGTWVVACQK